MVGDKSEKEDKKSEKKSKRKKKRSGKKSSKKEKDATASTGSERSGSTVESKDGKGDTIYQVRLGNMPALPKFEFLTGASSSKEGSSSATSTRGTTKDDDSDEEDSSSESQSKVSYPSAAPTASKSVFTSGK